MGPVRAPPTAERCEERECAHPATGPPALRALASAVGNRQFARLVSQERTSAAAIQRLAYWAESDPRQRSGRRSGTSVHNEVLPALGQANRLFTEAPVPQANKSAAALEDTRGYADLYEAKTTVGIEFPQNQSPRRLPSQRNTMYRGERFDHIGTSAPTVEARGGKIVITKLRAAPRVIVLGDLKGGMDNPEAADAPEQLEHYMQGFRIAAAELNEYGIRNPELVDPDRKGSREWHPKPRKFLPDEIEVPDYYTPGRARAQPSVLLVLVRATGSTDREWSRRHRIRGKLYVFADPGEREGVWVYVWAPDQEVALGDLPPHVRALGPEIAERLRQPLLTPPLARRVRPGAAPRPRKPLRPAVARQQHAVKDPFDYDKWTRAHRDLTDRAEAAANDPGVEDAEAAAAVDEANAGLRKYNLRAPKVAEAKLAGGRTVKEIKLWTGTSGALLGRFRRLFGSVFTKIAELYLKLRDRVRAMLKPSGGGKGFGGGFAGAALKAAYSVLKGAASHIVTKTAERLKTSLAEGTEKKLRSLIGSERAEAVEGGLEKLKKTATELESGLVEKLEDVAGGVVDRYKAIVDKIEDVKSIVGKALDIVDKVKWGARVIACLSPPGIGCLWILAQSVLEKAAARVVDTCWFKRKITPLIGKLSWVKKLPGLLAEEIRKAIVPLLPGPLKEVFAKIDTSEVPVGEGDIGCNADDDPERDRLTAERRAMWDLIEAVGEERYDALIEAIWATGIRFDKKLTVTEIYEAKKIIVTSRVTAEQLRHYAKYYAPFADKRKRGPLGEFLAGLVEMDTDSPPTFGESESGGGGGSGAGGTAIEAVPSKSPAPGGQKTPYTFVDVGAFDRKLAKGASATLDVTVKIRGKTVVLRRVPMVVVDRDERPDGGVRVVLGPKQEMVYDLGETPGSGLPRLITVSLTSRVWRTFPGKRPAAKRPEPAPGPAAEPEPEPAAAAP